MFSKDQLKVLLKSHPNLNAHGYATPLPAPRTGGRYGRPEQNPAEHKASREELFDFFYMIEFGAAWLWLINTRKTIDISRTS